MRIIKAQRPKGEKQIICPKCGSVLGYVNEDIYRYPPENIVQLHCPVCGFQIDLNDGNKLLD